MTYAIDPELVALLEFLPNVDVTDPATLRAEIAAFTEAGGFSVDTTGIAVTDHRAGDVRVRVYSPEANSAPRAALLYLHGGGFVIGAPETEESNAVGLARDLGIVIASVDYRLAPEDPYPAGLDDCACALAWLHEHATDLGVDATRIGIYGQSAGGGLAAALALRTRDRNGPPICFQLLAIPELDDRLDTPSMRAFVDTPLWNRPNAVLSWQHYLRGLDGDVPYEAAPARATDLSGLPPAYVSAMEFDPLRDEAIAYAAAILAAGGRAELHVFPGTFHGIALIGQDAAAVCRRAAEEERAALRRGLGLGV